MAQNRRIKAAQDDGRNVSDSAGFAVLFILMSDEKVMWEYRVECMSGQDSFYISFTLLIFF